VSRTLRFYRVERFGAIAPIAKECVDHRALE